MSEDWKAGDLAVCVDNGPHHSTLNSAANLSHLLVIGRAYRVQAVFVGPYSRETCLSVGVPVTTLDGGVGAWRFRKLNDEPDDIALIERIRKCKCRPARQPEPAL